MKQKEITHRKHSKWYILILSVCSLLLFCGLYLKYKDGQTYMQHQTETIFRSALRETLDLRSPSPLILNDDDLLLVPNEEINAETKDLEKYRPYVKNTYNDGLVFSPDSLMYRINILFSKRRIESECLVYYTNLQTREKVQSHSAIHVNNTPYHSKLTFSLGEQMFQIECFLNFPFFSILNKGSWNFCLSLALLTGCLLILLRMKFSYIKSKESIPNTQKDEVTNSLLSDNSKVFRFNTIFFNPKRGELYTESKTEYLTPILTQLMELFLHSPDHFLENEEILHSLWGNIGTKNKLNNLTSQLRKKLYSLDPHITLENYPRKGYQFKYDLQKEKLLSSPEENGFQPYSFDHKQRNKKPIREKSEIEY